MELVSLAVDSCEAWSASSLGARTSGGRWQLTHAGTMWYNTCVIQGPCRMQSRRRWRAIFYTTEAGRCPVLDAIRGLPKADRVEIGHTLRLVQEEGPDIGMPFTEQVSGELGAVRVRVGRTRWRILFFAHLGRELVILHLFAKKTRAMPRHEIEIAERRRRDWLRREGR